VRLDANGQREVRRMRWGLVPPFERDPGIGSRFIHARAETIDIVTVAANAAIAPVHDRMPAVLAESDWPKWLGESPATYEELKAMLRPCEDPIAVTPVAATRAPPPPRPPSAQFDLF
jgi:putative SOS response-associated peptidase YedK